MRGSLSTRGAQVCKDHAPAVVDGQVVVRKQLTLTTTIDHRYMDGAQGGKLATVIREEIEHPFRALEGLQGPPQ